MNWGETVTVPVIVVIVPWALVALAVTSLFRAWFVPRPFYTAEVHRREEERKAKDDALEANKTLIQSNNLLLRKDDVGLTTLQEIRDYIHRHDPPTPQGGGS